MAIEPKTQQHRRMEHRPGGATATKPRDAGRIGLIIGAALLIGVLERDGLRLGVSCLSEVV